MRVLFSLLLLLFLASLLPGAARAAAAQEEPAATRAVAVVPFANSAGAAADAWIGPGVAEMVSAELARRFEIRTADRDAIWRGASTLERPDEQALAALGARLDATWIIDGAYRRTGDRIRLTARLVDVASGAVLRTAEVDGTMGDFYTLPNQLTTRLSEGSPIANPAEPSAPPPAARVPPQPRRPGPSVAPRRVDPSAAAGGLGAPAVTGTLAIGPAITALAGGRPTVDSVRTPEAPVIDGRLDDTAWADAVRLTSFVQRTPVEGAPATENTEVYLAYDSANIYIGVYTHYSDRGLMRANRSVRDQLDRDDTVSVFFDPFMDQQRAYVFTVNGYGVQGDSIVGGGGGGGGGGFGGGGGGGGSGLPRGDASWDALFRSAGTLVEDGWTAEMAIPFKSIRYPARPSGEPHRWGFQIGRTIQGKNEAVVWAPVTRSIAGFLTQMGTLQGMTNLSTSRNLELLPTVTAVQFGRLDRTTGRFAEEDFSPSAGLSVKYGVTSDLTADFTFNPDFSQIESDQPQIEVNQRFPLFFSELRPFFLEGQDIFSTRGNVDLLHTRTIIDPRYGGKLTGKIGTATIGVLVANDEAPGRADSPTDPAFGETAKFLIGRARYDLYPGSYIGAIVTDREFLDAFSRVGAVDGRFRLGRTNDFEFRLAQSSTRDDLGVERSGKAYDIGYGHTGNNLEYGVSHYSIEPGFRTATGFVRRTDVRRTGGDVRYRFWPQHWLTNWGPGFDYARNYDFAGTLQDESAGIGVNFQFARNIRANVETSREMERFGGTDFWKSRRQIFAAVNTSRRFSVGGGMNWGHAIRYTTTPFLGDSRGGRLFLNFLPSSRLATGLNVNYSRLVDPRTNTEVFDVKIVRSVTSYQFTERLQLRNILEYNTLNRTVDANVLFAYRVNAGTVFYLGYDDHHRQGARIDPLLFPDDGYQRTNRAFFTKFSYLFRY